MVSPFKYSMSPSKQLFGVGFVEVAVVKSEVAVEVEVAEVIGQIGLIVVVGVPVGGGVAVNVDVEMLG